MKSEHRKLYKASGEISSPSRLVNFLYTLMRDEVSVGVVQELLETQVMMVNADGEYIENIEYTNGWLAEYAMYIADRLLEEKDE